MALAAVYRHSWFRVLSAVLLTLSALPLASAWPAEAATPISITNSDSALLRIYGQGSSPPVSSGFAAIVGEDFPILHASTAYQRLILRR